MTEATTTPAGLAAAALLRLRDTLNSEMTDMTTALDELTDPRDASGPLAALTAFLDRGAEWLAEFEDDDASAAAELLDSAADRIRATATELTDALALIRPLAG
jgi:hypothetical protein